MKLKTTFAVFALTLPLLIADHHSGKVSATLTGDWNVQAESDNGSREFTFSFEHKDGKWSGKSDNNEGRVRSMDRVKLNGKKFVLETDMEANGEKGMIRVTGELNDTGEAFKGKWAMLDSSDTERMSGDIKGEKVFVLDLAGEWETVAVIDEEENSAITSFKKDGEKWTGGFKGDEHEATFTKIKTEGKNVSCEFALTVDGEELEFRINAESKEADLLEGKWVVFSSSGQEANSGKWSAKRKKAFELAGTWKGTAEVNGETRESTYVIEKKDEKYQGKASSEAGSVDLSSVLIKDNHVTIKFPFGSIEVTVKAEVKKEELVGKWSATSDDGTELGGDWKATKKK